MRNVFKLNRPKYSTSNVSIQDDISCHLHGTYRNWSQYNLYKKMPSMLGRSIFNIPWLLLLLETLLMSWASIWPQEKVLSCSVASKSIPFFILFIFHRSVTHCTQISSYSNWYEQNFANACKSSRVEIVWFYFSIEGQQPFHSQLCVFELTS